MLTLVCDECMTEITGNMPDVVSNKQFDHACDALRAHFAGIPPDQLVSTSRMFPGHMRADVQAGIDRLFSASPLRFFGIHEAAPLRDVELRGAEPRRAERSRHRAGAVS